MIIDKILRSIKLQGGITLKIKYVKDMFYGLDHSGKAGNLMYSEMFLFDSNGKVEDYSFELDGYGKSQEKLRYVEIVPNIKYIHQKALALIEAPNHTAAITHLEDHILIQQSFEC